MRVACAWLVAGASLFAGSCSGPGAAGPPVPVPYVGSSTVAVFLREAEPVYGRIQFELDTAPESAGGERAILAGETQLAGIATTPNPEILRAGIAATLIGRDAIAVIVAAGNPVRELSSEELRGVFTGEITNWSELGGAQLSIQPFIAAPDSATSSTFQRELLGGEEYGASCVVVQPDREIIDVVALDPGGIGQISFSFLEGEQSVHAIAIDGEAPTVTNFDYPIARPLYLLRRAGDPVIDAFAAWAESAAGQRVVMRHFVGTRVVGEVGASEGGERKGRLVVYTRREPYYDGGIYYYPHTPYKLMTRYGEPVRNVRNHRGMNDEQPTRVELLPGTYLVEADGPRSGKVEFFVRIEVGKLTEADVEEVLRSRE